MNNKRTFRLDLDLKDIDKSSLIVGKVKQLDGTRIVGTLTNFGEPMDLSDCLVRMFIRRPDKTELYQKEGIVVEGQNTVVIDCVDEIFELIGDVELEIEVIDLDGYIETMPTIKVAVLDKINDDTQREIIRIQEISMITELKSYIENTAAYIDNFKEMIGQLADPDYNSLLDALVSTKETIDSLAPAIQLQTERLETAINEVEQKELDFKDSEEERNTAESSRELAEQFRIENENLRKSEEEARKSNETEREKSEYERASSENLRRNYEESRNAAEDIRNEQEVKRESAEEQRRINEENRQQQEQEREETLSTFRQEIEDISVRVDDVPNHGNFNVDIVAKGNIYPTLDGIKPVHFGPPTKNAGNVLMPYARAIGGFTKDGSGVRTIGFIAKPMDADKSFDITEDQNSDAVFLGTNVSQLYLYSKEGYPSVVAQNQISPIATQDWVMRLIDGLGLLNKGHDDEAIVTSKNPFELFDLTTSENFSRVVGKWSLDDYNNAVTLTEGEIGKYNPLIGFSEINEVTYSYSAETSKKMFVGLWRTDNYIYGARIDGHTLSVSYFGRDGIRGGAYNLTIREDLFPGELITIHYNTLNEIWEFYKFDENRQPILIYQLSKFMMSGFPEFDNGRDVQKNFALLISEEGVVHFSDNPAAQSMPMENVVYSF